MSLKTSTKKIRDIIWKGKEGLIIGMTGGAIAWILAKANGIEYATKLPVEFSTYSLMGVIDSIKVTISGYDILIFWIIIGGIIGFLIDILNLKKYLRRGK